MNKIRATEEQLAYAKILDSGMKIGLLGIILTFSVYMAGLLVPHVPLNDLPKYWAMPVKQYLSVAGIHPGWTWLGMLGKGDFLNFLGIAFLAGVTITCLFPIIPIFLRKGDKTYAAIAIMEILVLVFAASGILKSGGH